MFSRLHRGATLAAVFLTGSLIAVVPAAAVSGGTVTNYGFAAKISMDGRACSGALVEPTLVLTAASCFPENPQGGVPAKATTVIVGRPDLTTTTGTVAKVTQLYVRTDRDVALARIDTIATGTTPLPLAAASGVPGSAETVNLIGWGRTGDEWVPDKVRRAQFTTTASTATTLSLTSAEGADACKGDAGAPIMRTDSAGNLSIAAVSSTSWQHGCLAETETRQGTTGARVDDLSAWIRGQAIVGTAKAVGHGVTLSWTPLAASDDATYSIYASSAGPATNSATQLIGTTKATTFLHSATARKTWSYLVVASTGAASPQFTATTGARSPTDFTGDGKGDIATFVRGTDGDVYVAASDGSKFVGNSVLWHDRFSIGAEIPLSGDFNGDGKADVATFSRGSSADVYVALSDGTKFTGNGTLWDDFFAANSE
ncbi:trypsin-like serine protease, partial [Amycolatopsis vastitatis]